MRVVTVVIACALAASACSSDAPDVRIGIKRNAIDLAFAAERPEEQRRAAQAILGELPVPQLTQPVYELRLPGSLADGLSLDICPKARAGAVPEEPAASRIAKRPVAGKYTYVHKGSVSIVTPIVTVDLPYPPVTQREVREVREVRIDGPAGLGSETAVRYELVQKLGSSGTTATYDIRSDGLALERVLRTTSGQTRTFRPTAVTEWNKTTGDYETPEAAQAFFVFVHGTEGTEWRTSGTDTDTKATALVQAKTTRREIVDVCGTVVDTYRVESVERVQTVEGDYQAATKDGEPNVFHFATQLGPLPVREEVHLVEQVLVDGPEGTKIPVTVEWNYTSVLAMRPRA